jgi:hypothetical protein
MTPNAPNTGGLPIGPGSCPPLPPGPPGRMTPDPPNTGGLPIGPGSCPPLPPGPPGRMTPCPPNTGGLPIGPGSCPPLPPGPPGRMTPDAPNTGGLPIGPGSSPPLTWRTATGTTASIRRSSKRSNESIVRLIVETPQIFRGTVAGALNGFRPADNSEIDVASGAPGVRG